MLWDRGTCYIFGFGIIIIIIIIVVVVVVVVVVSCYRPFLPGTSPGSIECFPGTSSKFFLKLLVTFPVAPIITGTIVHFFFHIRCISIRKLLYLSFFSVSFCATFLSVGIATSISVHVFSFLLLNIISCLFVYYYYYYYCCCCRPGYRSLDSDSLRAGRSGDQIPLGARFSTPVQSRRTRGRLSSLRYNSYRVCPGRKATEAWRWPHTPI